MYAIFIQQVKYFFCPLGKSIKKAYLFYLLLSGSKVIDLC